MDWVKVMCNLLDHRKIKMIRKGPKGNTLVLLWLLMLTEAGKCNRGGYLMAAIGDTGVGKEDGASLAQRVA